jgi:hypothetical protein
VWKWKLPEMFLVVVSTREFLLMVETGVGVELEDNDTTSCGAVRPFVGLAWLPGGLLSTVGSAVLVGAGVGCRDGSRWLVAAAHEGSVLGVKGDTSVVSVWRLVAVPSKAPCRRVWVGWSCL